MPASLGVHPVQHGCNIERLFLEQQFEDCVLLHVIVMIPELRSRVEAAVGIYKKKAGMDVSSLRLHEPSLIFVVSKLHQRVARVWVVMLRDGIGAGFVHPS